MRRTFRIDFTAKDVSPSRQLGPLGDALLGAEADRVIVSFGSNANCTQALGATFWKWLERNDRLVRTRVTALAVVVPSLWIRLQWRLFLLLSQPVAPLAVHGTEAKALAWLERYGTSPQTAN